MSDFTDDLAGALTDIGEYAGETITYNRGAESVEITDAIPITGRRPQSVDQGAMLQTDELDWGLDRDQLILDEEEATPQRGDTIEREINGQTLTYTVLPRDTTAPYRWSDTGQTQYRVFTKLTSKA